MSFEFTVSEVIPGTPRAIYDAWMSSAGHTAMTGGQAAEVAPGVGGRFRAWGGYITGATLELQPGKRIVQSWRTSKFAHADPDSRIEVTLEAVPGGTLLTLRHSEVPDGHTSYRDGGWQDNYFTPMKAHFAP